MMAGNTAIFRHLRFSAPFRGCIIKAGQAGHNPKRGASNSTTSKTNHNFQRYQRPGDPVALATTVTVANFKQWHLHQNRLSRLFIIDSILQPACDAKNILDFSRDSILFLCMVSTLETWSTMLCWVWIWSWHLTGRRLRDPRPEF